MTGRWNESSSRPFGQRRTSVRTRLVRAGFDEVDRAGSCLHDEALSRLLPLVQEPEEADRELDPVRSELVEELSRVADPDLALLSLVRLASAVGSRDEELRGLLASLGTGGPDSSDSEVPGVSGAGASEASAEEMQVPDERDEHRRRLLGVLGASRALGDFLVSHPDHLAALSPAHAVDAPDQAPMDVVLAEAVAAALDPDGTGDNDGAECTRVEAATAAMRVAYRDRLLAIAADDVTCSDPLAHIPVVVERMTRLADAALEAGLAIARAGVGEQADSVALAVIAMGKTGARELNYVSDVDVIYVVGPADRPDAPETHDGAVSAIDAIDAIDEDELVRLGTDLAIGLARATSATGREPPLWPLDTALRPEGKDGALVRTLRSHVTYYERWAASWEFQALLKARPCAGDAGLGAAYASAVDPFVWGASSRENFVDDARAMRRRVENESGKGGGEDRRIKLGPGGLRDVEFTVQLLQLVHGRGDERLHVRSTLGALAELSAAGYVGRSDAAELDSCYRLLRLLEHRSQLYRLQRTHDLPRGEDDLRRLGRGIDRRIMGEPEALWSTFTSVRRRVRALHEEIYYRPLLAVAATLSADEMTMSPQAARERLKAAGYLDPDGALRHIHALTEGVSRRAEIQRQLLPVMISWLGRGPDPDNGLLSFRLLSERVGGSHWYLAMLRDSRAAARSLCHVLSGARWTTERLAERPESIAWLDDASELTARDPAALHSEVRSLLRRRVLTADSESALEGQAAEAVHAVMSVRTRELVRAALADSLNGVDPERTARILTDTTDAVLDGVLSLATGVVIALRDGPDAVASGPERDGTWSGALARHAMIAMGRLGGAETTYASDADVLFVHEARPGADRHEAADEAEAVARWVVRLLSQAQPHPFEVDADLRPEGRQGPMSRSLGSYADYYERWSAVWERQALLRARACAGDAELGRAFEELVEPLRWSPDGLDDDGLRQIRRLKARMEAERLPRGTNPARHIKLGPGGLSDVEWAVQVLQLQHAARVPELRTTSTLEALDAARSAGLLTESEEAALRGAWLLASRVRAATVLGTGRDHGERIEVLPNGLREIRLVGRLVGLAAGRERQLEDLYRRHARHARRVVERVVFGRTSETRKAGAGSATRTGDNLPVGDDSRAGGSRDEAAGRRNRSDNGQLQGMADGQRARTRSAGASAPSRSETPEKRPASTTGGHAAKPPRRAARRGGGPYPWS